MHVGEQKMQYMDMHIPALRGYKHDPKKCDACQRGGARKHSFRVNPATFRKRPPKVYANFGDRITTDLCGPFPESVTDKCKYAITFYDVATKTITTHFLQTKSKEEVLDAFKLFLSENASKLPNGVKEFHSDNGSEYINSDMEQFCEELCIRRSFSVPHSPAQNGHAERVWGIVLRKMRISLTASGLPESFWTYAMEHASLIHNILRFNRDIPSPYESLYGEPYEYSKLHAFGCKCYYLVPDADRKSKLSPRALPAVYIGVDDTRSGVLVFVPHLQRVTTAFHVVFSETEYLSKDDMEGADRFRVPVTKRVTIRLPNDATVKRKGPSREYQERRNKKEPLIDDPSLDTQGFSDLSENEPAHVPILSDEPIADPNDGPPSRRTRQGQLRGNGHSDFRVRVSMLRQKAL
jgi:transposase InsO family protein